jgi:hypothetical protein
MVDYIQLFSDYNIQYKNEVAGWDRYFTLVKKCVIIYA